MNKFTKIAMGVVASIGLVIGGGAYAGKHFGHGMKGEYMIKKLEKKLDLSAEQVESLKSVQSYMKEKRANQDRTATKAKLVEMLKGEKLDQDAALSMMNEKVKTMQDSAPEMISKVADFTDNLTAEQRTKLLEMVEKFSGRMEKRRGH